MSPASPATATQAALERRLAALGCGDAVAGLHELVGVSPARYLFPHSLSPQRKCDPAPCDDLLSLLEARARRSPRLAWPHALRGRVLRALDRKEEAAAAFERALALAPRDARTLAWRAEFLLHAEGPSARTAAAMNDAARAAPDSPWPAIWTAAALLPGGADARVMTLLDAALAARPRSVPALLLRAVAHERRARFDLALGDAAAAARLEPDCVGALALRGRLEARLGRAEDAAAAFAAATRLDPGAKEFYGHIATADRPIGQGVCGLEQLDDYIRTHPNAAWAYALRGDMLRSVYERLEDGLADLRRAVKLEPRTPWMRACLARTQVTYKVGAAKGLSGLRLGIAQDPRCGWLHSWLAESYRHLKRPDAAVRHFRRAIALSPRFPQAHVWLGRVHGENGRWGAALAEFTRAVRLDCDYGFAYAKRGQALARLGRHAEALADFERAVRLKSHGAEWIETMRAQSLQAVDADRPAGRRDR